MLYYVGVDVNIYEHIHEACHSPRSEEELPLLLDRFLSTCPPIPYEGMVRDQVRRCMDRSDEGCRLCRTS